MPTISRRVIFANLVDHKFGWQIHTRLVPGFLKVATNNDRERYPVSSLFKVPRSLLFFCLILRVLASNPKINRALYYGLILILVWQRTPKAEEHFLISTAKRTAARDTEITNITTPGTLDKENEDS